MRQRIAWIGLVVSLAAGCATESAHREVPYAVLEFQRADTGWSAAFGRASVTPVTINERAPNVYDRGGLRRYRIDPGAVVLHVTAQSSRQVAASAELQFDVVAGETYHVTRKLEIKHIRFLVDDSTDQRVVDMLAEKVLVPETVTTTIPIYMGHD